MKDNHNNGRANLADYVKTIPLYLLPHHALSRIILRATRWRFAPWKNSLIRRFIKHFKVDLSEALETNPKAYESFNRFFTRALRDDARIISANQEIVFSPVDGTVSQIGAIADGRIIQAKGRTYSLEELLGGTAITATDTFDTIVILSITTDMAVVLTGPITSHIRVPIIVSMANTIADITTITTTIPRG